MTEPRPLEVVFLTNYTDFCYRTIPALAQMADDFKVRLTILHASGDRVPTDEDRTKLASFFPEADSYPNCRRTVMKGSPLEAVHRLLLIHPIDLLAAPASDPLGLPRFWRPAFRARLMRETRLPLWTIDRRTDLTKLRGTPHRIGCWIDFHRGWANSLTFAGAYAEATGAELHILHALPDISEGMLAVPGDTGSRPLHPKGIVDSVTRAASTFRVPTRVHIAENDRRRTQTRLIADARLDLLFSGDPNPALPHWLAPRPRLMTDCVPCPVIHIPVDTEVPVWRLHRERPLLRLVPAAEAPRRMRDLPFGSIAAKA